jgi:hypothetical protein
MGGSWPLATAVAWVAAFAALAAATPSAAQTVQAATAWPHVIAVNRASVTIYQPQAIAWPDHERLTARAAIAITRPTDKTPVLGTIEVSFATLTDAASGEVRLSDGRLVSSHFPALDTEQAALIDEQIKQTLPTIATRPVALQAVLLSLKQLPEAQNVALQNDPPVVFYSNKPASLVVFDGEPVLAPVAKTGLSFAVNTNWDVFTDGKDWYLLNNGSWLAAPAYSGPWRAVAKLPPGFNSLPADANFAVVRKAIPPKQSAAAPAILVSTKPAEIIVTAGPPQFVPVSGTGLQGVKNTNATLFFEPSSGRFFLLVSGRWFSAAGLDGPWQYASDKLPPDFALIPPDGPQAQVLASVPGTSQAQLAVLQAQVPRQATLKTDMATLTVIYAGPPRFAPIPGTTMSYAVNTSFEVIETGGRYYVCHQGAWFVGASPEGPWALAASVPPVIYMIPPTSPLYNVTYVKIYAATPTTVTYGYTTGYTMGFVSAGVVVYGTGYYYPPVVVAGPVPVYYPYPYSYVGNVTYNSTTGAWTQGGTVYGPYGGVAKGGTYYNPTTGASAAGGAIYGPNGGVGAFSAYNPTTGSYAHGSASWGPDGGTANASYYNARTGVSGSTTQNSNPYSRWGSSTFTGPNQTVHTESGSNAQGSAGAFSSSTGAQGAGYRGAGGNQGGVVKTQSGDVYAGHDGNVYQHSADGWSKWNDGGWQPVTPPSSPATQSPGAQSPRSQTAQGGTQGNSRAATQSQAQTKLSQRSSQPQASARQAMDPAAYQQLEQDRQARFAGSQSRFGQTGGGFAGGRFGGGGGRLRR